MNPSASPRVAVVGLGYVGLTLAVALARRGLDVAGVEKRPDVVEMTNQGIPHFSEIGLAEALGSVLEEGKFKASTSFADVPPCQYYVITVGTPLHATTQLPRLDMIQAASREVSGHFEPGATVILRSTVQIGTARTVVKPVLDEAGKPYFLAMCPERTLEGDALRELSSLPQIVGGLDEAAADCAVSLFSRLTPTIVRVESLETAEMIKLVDNTYRDISFAFGNEIARACEAVGVNAHDVIKFGKFGYPRTNVARPGLVGGPCLAKDPHILLHSLRPHGVDLEITRSARLINERQPAETVQTILDIADRIEPSRSLSVAILGAAFKGIPETDDLRGSMALKVIEAVQRTGRFREIRVFDPVIPARTLGEAIPGTTAHDRLDDALDGVDIAIIANNHPFFARLNIDSYRSKMGAGSIMYDYWNNLDNEPRSKKAGFYYTVGNIA